MTDKQQIEQLKEALQRYVAVYGKTQLQADGLYTTAELMSKFGITALPKNAVVLTKTEYDCLMKSVSKITKQLAIVTKENERLYDVKLGFEHQMTHQSLTEYVGADVLEAEARKETAKEILREVGKVCGDYQWFKNLCKQFGVEVEK